MNTTTKKITHFSTRAKIIIVALVVGVALFAAVVLPNASSVSTEDGAMTFSLVSGSIIQAFGGDGDGGGGDAGGDGDGGGGDGGGGGGGGGADNRNDGDGGGGDAGGDGDGGGGDAGGDMSTKGGKDDDKKYSPKKPLCELNASPSTVNAGGSSVLTWDTTYANTVSIDQGIGSVPVDGSESVSPSATKTYTLTATGDGGSATCYKKVTVVEEPKVCELQISKVVDKTSSTIGDTIEYTIDFKNIGTRDCTGGGVKVRDTIDENLTYVSETHSSNVSAGYGSTPVLSGGVLNWNAQTLTPGESGWVKWKGSVREKDSCGNFSIYNEAKITAKELNNFATWITSNTVETTIKNECTTTPEPTCTLIVDPTSILKDGSATLSWTTTNADSVAINNNIGNVSEDGSVNVSPSTTTLYKLAAVGEGGSVLCEATLTVDETPEDPMCTLGLNTATITKGGSATLSWTTEHAVSASIDQAIGAVALTGTTTVSPLATTTYTLTALGEGDASVACVATLAVEDEPAGEPLSCDSFSASPATFTNAGTTTLSWNTTSATEVSVSDGVGIVPVDGSKDVFVGSSTTFVLSATDGTDTVTCQAPVVIEPVTILPTCDSFVANPAVVNPGDTTALSWSTSNANNVSIGGVGNVSVDGNTTVTVNGNTTYTLTASDGVNEVQCTAPVTVNTGGGGGGGGGSSSPRCEFTASKTNIEAGEEVTLSWSNTRTNEITIDDNRGDRIVDTARDRDIDPEKLLDEDEDSIVVTPTQSTSYILTVLRGSQDRTCTVDINVGGVTVTSSRSQTPLVAGISLDAVPYTGFEAGPFLTSVFYALLLMWGLGVAYVLVIKGGSTRGLGAALHAGNMGVREDHSPVSSLYVAPRVTGTAPRIEEVSADTRGGYAAFPLQTHEEENVQTFVSATPVLQTLDDSYEVTEQEPEGESEAEDVYVALENRAHEAYTLLSSDALAFIVNQTPVPEKQFDILDTLIELAKGAYPSENGWIVINKERVMSLLG